MLNCHHIMAFYRLLFFWIKKENQIWALNTFNKTNRFGRTIQSASNCWIPYKTKKYKLNLWYDACWCDKIWGLIKLKTREINSNKVIEPLRRATHSENVFDIYGIQCSLSLIIINNYSDQRKSLRVLIAFSIQ